eukprot:symbB.v1.2.027990.t1/scaffold2917.1/size67260/5
MCPSLKSDGFSLLRCWREQGLVEGEQRSSGGSIWHEDATGLDSLLPQTSHNLCLVLSRRCYSASKWSTVRPGETGCGKCCMAQELRVSSVDRTSQVLCKMCEERDSQHPHHVKTHQTDAWQQPAGQVPHRVTESVSATVRGTYVYA